MTSKRRRGAPYLARPVRQVDADLAARIAQGEEMLERMRHYEMSPHEFGGQMAERGRWRDSNVAYLNDAFTTDEIAEGYCLPMSGGHGQWRDSKQFNEGVRALVANEISYLVGLRAKLPLYEALPEDTARAQALADLTRMDPHDRRFGFSPQTPWRLEKWLAGPGIVCVIAAVTGQVVSYSGLQIGSINAPLTRLLTFLLGLVLVLLSPFVTVGEPPNQS